MGLPHNSSSAFYLCPGESPKMILVTSQFDKSKYHFENWVMKCVLLSKNKFKFVNRETLEPMHDDDLYKAWDQYNVMVISWITCTLTTQISQSTIYIDNGKDISDDHKDGF